MHKVHEMLVTRGLPVEKFYGKWPFLRLLGTQEIASTVFSLLNMLPHLIFLRKTRHDLPQNYAYNAVWLAHAIWASHVWLWSTAFHAKENWLTELMDYHCASGLVIGYTVVPLIRVLSLESIRSQVLVALPIALFWASHVAYMQFVHFNYGYNMQVCVFFAVTGIVLWVSWAIFGHVTMRRPYAWKIAVQNVLLLCLGALELWDFPPVWGIFDAHSLWHGLTPLCTILLYQFVREDARFESSKKTF